jgi:hypothetical protein
MHPDLLKKMQHQVTKMPGFNIENGAILSFVFMDAQEQIKLYSHLKIQCL